MSIIPYYTGNIPVYRFYLTYLTITYEVFPLNFLETKIIDELEGDNVFYRSKFSGVLLFGTNDKVLDVSGVEQNRADDFTLLWTIESLNPCARLDLTITKTLSGVVTTYWEGYFSTTDGIFDIDRCTFEVIPLLDDEYNTILENAEKEYNILTVTHNIQTKAIRGTISYTYSRNMWLMTVIRYLANDATIGISPGCTVSSTFFENATNPATASDNDLLFLTIAQKSDIMYPGSSEPATSAMLSWNGLMGILWGMFQVKWSYDLATDTINVEHISFFITTGSLDIRNQLLTQSSNKYSYLKTKMPKYEFFKFAEADEINFVGTYIYYPDSCIEGDYTKNKKEILVNATTDIEYIQNAMVADPAIIDPNGFVILCNYEYTPGVYRVVVSSGAYQSANARLNMPMSWANLHDKYYRHNRSSIEGYLNGSLVTFYSAVKTKKQDVSIKLCTAFNSEQEIISELGTTYFGGVNGIIQRAEKKPTGDIDLNILYGVPENPIVPIVTKIANFIQTSETTVEVWLSSPSDANYSMHIWEEMYDGGCLLICSEGQAADPETFVINLGATYATFTFADTCTPFLAGYTFWVQIDDATMLANGWTVTFERDFSYIQSGCP
jgi:hypothetical protein